MPVLGLGAGSVCQGDLALHPWLPEMQACSTSRLQAVWSLPRQGTGLSEAHFPLSPVSWIPYGTCFPTPPWGAG